jgi:hypothetical protein
MKLLRTNFRPFSTAADVVSAYPVISSLHAATNIGPTPYSFTGTGDDQGMTTYGPDEYGASTDRNIVIGGLYGFSGGAHGPSGLGSWLEVTLDAPITEGIALSYTSWYSAYDSWGPKNNRFGSGSTYDHALIEINSQSLNASVLFKFTPTAPSQVSPFSGPDFMELSVVFLSAGVSQTVYTSGQLPALNYKTKQDSTEISTASLGAHWAYPISFKFDYTTKSYDFFVYHERIQGSLLLGNTFDNLITLMLDAADASFIIGSIPAWQDPGTHPYGGHGSNGISNLAINNLQGNTDNDLPDFMLMYQTNMSSTGYTSDGNIIDPQNITDIDSSTRTTFPDSNILYLNIDNTNVIALTGYPTGEVTIPTDGTTALDSIAVTLHGIVKQPFNVGKSLRVCVVDNTQTELTSRQVITPTVHKTDHSFVFDKKDATGQTGGAFTINDINSNMQLKIETY